MIMEIFNNDLQWNLKNNSKNINPIQNGPFWGCSRMQEAIKSFINYL